MSDQEQPDWANEMLDAWKKANSDFGPQPKPAVPVLTTDTERLEAARKSLWEVMQLAFPCEKKTWNREDLKRIWSVANTALARTERN